MLRKAGLVFAGVVGLVLAMDAVAAEEKTPSIKQVMKAVAGKQGLCAKCGAAGKEMKWEDAQQLAKTLSDCCANLPKNKCPKGDAASWQKLSKQYADQAAAVSKAAQDKDAKAYSAALGAFTKSCKTCHDAHK